MITNTLCSMQKTNKSSSAFFTSFSELQITLNNLTKLLKGWKGVPKNFGVWVLKWVLLEIFPSLWRLSEFWKKNLLFSDFLAHSVKFLCGSKFLLAGYSMLNCCAMEYLRLLCWVPHSNPNLLKLGMAIIKGLINAFIQSFYTNVHNRFLDLRLPLIYR